MLWKMPGVLNNADVWLSPSQYFSISLLSVVNKFFEVNDHAIKNNLLITNSMGLAYLGPLLIF